LYFVRSTHYSSGFTYGHNNNRISLYCQLFLLSILCKFPADRLSPISFPIHTREADYKKYINLLHFMQRHKVYYKEEFVHIARCVSLWRSQ